MTYHGVSRPLLNNFNIIAYLFQEKKNYVALIAKWAPN